jgi:SPP1 gp7 family putative phage head morphogenesis protein
MTPHLDAKRHAAFEALSASRQAEHRYVLDLVGIMGSIHKGVLQVVEREHLAPPPPPPPDPLRSDAAPSVAPARRIGLGDKLLQTVFSYARPQTERAFDRMAKEVTKKHDPALQARLEKDLGRRIAERQAVIAIHPHLIAGVASSIDHARAKNVALITRASKDFLAQVRGVLEETQGLHVDDIRKALQERVGVSQSRAVLIARDQTLKLNSNIIQHRQRAAGISQYRWSGTLDERERPIHRELEGSIQDWDAPPETNEDGDTNHPGEDIHCRCVPAPYLPELDDPDYDPEEEGEPEEQAPDDEPEAADEPEGDDPDDEPATPGLAAGLPALEEFLPGEAAPEAEGLEGVEAEGDPDLDPEDDPDEESPGAQALDDPFDLDDPYKLEDPEGFADPFGLDVLNPGEAESMDVDVVGLERIEAEAKAKAAAGTLTPAAFESLWAQGVEAAGDYPELLATLATLKP